MIRVELRNEYGLGATELYKKEAATGDDPKALLDGVAVSGLVGILRQLGDLAEFAAEVFHGLQEQVTMTSSRSHKLMSRVRHIEAALPSLEKAVLAQKSHLHFAYTAGSYWHPRIRCEKHHFIYSDLPRFVMDSYEECRGPPRLDLLDKFVPGGPGSCLKRYSDPTFFRRTSGGNDGASGKKQSKDKKSRRNKKRRSWRKNGEVSWGASSASYSGRMHFVPLNVDGQTSPSQSLSANDVTIKPDQADQSNSLDSRKGSGYEDCVFHNQPEEQYLKESSSPSVKHHDGCLDYAFLNENGGVIYDSNNIPHEYSGKGSHIKRTEEAYKEDSGYVPNSLLEEQTGPVSSYVTWEEKADADIGKPAMQDCSHDEILETFPRNFGVDSMDREEVNFQTTASDVNFETKASDSVDQSATKYINHEGGFGTISMNLEADTKRAASNFEEIEDHGDFQLHNGKVNVRTVSDDRPEDIESETDNFMDALNTIESESETDVDYQSKQEGKKSSNLNKTTIEDDMDGIHLQLSDSHASSFDLYDYQMKQEQERPSYLTKEPVDDDIGVNRLQLSGSHASSFDFDAATNRQETSEYNTIPGKSESQLVTDSNFDKATSRNQSNSITLEHSADLQYHEMASSHLTVVSLPDVDSYGSSDVHGCLSVESLVRNSSSSACREQFSIGVASDKITSNPPESQKPPPEPSVVTSVQFWTNGGLLGLEPSKPPDCSVLNAAGQVSVATRDETSDVACYNQDGQDSDVVHNRSQDVTHMSSSNCSTSYQDEDEGGFSRWKIARRLPSADLDVGHQKLSDYHTCNDTSLNNGPGNTSVVPGNVQSKVSETDGSSFRMFEIGNRLLANGFHRRLSFDRDENPNSISSLDTGIYEQNSRQSIAHQSFSGRSKAFSRGASPIMSPSSSPPLGHMKISFQPVDGFETSKLRLKFPNGNNGHENSRDVFPSFQLVPEPGIILHDINSNSDEDTFCGSSPYTSDDCLSHQSEPNSEVWESGESPAIKDHELYDALRRISLTESISTSLGTGGTTQGDIRNHCDLQSSFAENGVGRSQSAQFFDLPSLDTLNLSFKQDLSDNSNCKSPVKSYSLKEPTPPPPPLPPMQWRATKPHLDEGEDRQHYVPGGPSYVFDLKLSKLITSQQPKPAPLQQDQIVEAAHRLKSKQQVGESDVQRETNQTANGKGMDEKEDFLHQIRTKSFNLRRTVTTKPTAQTGLSTSVKVTAILEKANAIRQAVGSDDGDDNENWSDN